MRTALPMLPSDILHQVVRTGAALADVREEVLNTEVDEPESPSVEAPCGEAAGLPRQVRSVRRRTAFIMDNALRAALAGS